MSSLKYIALVLVFGLFTAFSLPQLVFAKTASELEDQIEDIQKELLILYGLDGSPGDGSSGGYAGPGDGSPVGGTMPGWNPAPTEGSGTSGDGTLSIPAPLKFTIGNTVSVTSNLNMRTSAGGTLIRTIPLGTQGKIIGGPVSMKGIWWNVDFAKLGSGWSVQDYLAKGIQTTSPDGFGGGSSGGDTGWGPVDGLRVSASFGGARAIVTGQAKPSMAISSAQFGHDKTKKDNPIVVTFDQELNTAGFRVLYEAPNESYAVGSNNILLSSAAIHIEFFSADNSLLSTQKLGTGTGNDLGVTFEGNLPQGHPRVKEPVKSAKIYIPMSYNSAVFFNAGIVYQERASTPSSPQPQTPTNTVAATWNTGCLVLSRDMGSGSALRTGVSNLQKYLVASGNMSDPGLGLGTYGPKTTSAVASFQVSQGISPSSGFVGPLTRTKIQSLSCGAGSTSTVSAPTLSGPTSSGGVSVTLTANDDDGVVAVRKGSSIELSWETEGATNCTLGNPFNQGSDTHGHERITSSSDYYPSAEGIKYSIYCLSPRGVATDEVFVAFEGTAAANTSVQTPTKPTSSATPQLQTPPQTSGSSTGELDRPPVLRAKTASACGGGVELSWDKVEGATGYRLWRALVTVNDEPIYEGNDLSFTDENVLASSGQDYRVQAYNSNKKTAISGPVQGYAPGYCSSAASPTIDFRANGKRDSVVIQNGANVTLSWDTENTKFCRASGGIEGWSGGAATGWIEMKDAEGSEQTGPIYKLAGTTGSNHTAYVLACFGRGGSTLSVLSVIIP